MKRLFSVLAVVCGVLMVAGCGGDSKDRAEDLDDPETREKYLEDAIEVSELIESSGVWTKKFSDVPYTGWVKKKIGSNEAMLGRMDFGRKEGLWITWHSGGSKRTEGHFKDGKEEGEWRIYRRLEEVIGGGSSEGIITGRYQNGMREGIWVCRQKNDTEIWRATFEGDKRHGPSLSWYINGQKEKEKHYRYDKLINAVAWKPNGEKCNLTNIINGSGVLVDYVEDGWKISEGTYKDGNKDGLWIYYNEDGTEWHRDTYKDGKQVDD